MTNLPKNHPVRYLIELAANGKKLTASDLNLLDHADLPTNESLSKYRAHVDSAARRVAAAAGPNGGNNADAIAVAQEEWGSIAYGMTDDQRAVNTTAGPDDSKMIDDLVANLFNNN